MIRLRAAARAAKMCAFNRPRTCWQVMWTRRCTEHNKTYFSCCWQQRGLFKVSSQRDMKFSGFIGASPCWCIGGWSTQTKSEKTTTIVVLYLAYCLKSNIRCFGNCFYAPRAFRVSFMMKTYFGHVFEDCFPQKVYVRNAWYQCVLQGCAWLQCKSINKAPHPRHASIVV